MLPGNLSRRLKIASLISLLLMVLWSVSGCISISLMYLRIAAGEVIIRWAPGHPWPTGCETKVPGFLWDILPYYDIFRFPAIPLGPRIRLRSEYMVHIPILPFLAISFGILLYYRWKSQSLNKILRCGHCGYDLNGNTSGVCSECGNYIDPSD